MALVDGTYGAGRPTRVDETELMLRSLVSELRDAGAQRLPPETELSEQLGVARSTLRAALSRLESEGEIARRRRVGTIITTPEEVWERRSSLAYPVDMILSLSDYLRAVGVDYAVRAVGIRRDPANAEVTTALGLAHDSAVFSASRLYEVTGQPAAFLEHLLPTVLGGHDVHIESLTEGVTTFLRETEHIRLTHVDSTFTAEAASPDLARALQVDEGAPLLVMRAKLFADSPCPVALGRLVFRPDLLCLTVSAKADPAADTRRGLGVASLVNTVQRTLEDDV